MGKLCAPWGPSRVSAGAQPSGFEEMRPSAHGGAWRKHKAHHAGCRTDEANDKQVTLKGSFSSWVRVAGPLHMNET